MPRVTASPALRRITGAAAQAYPQRSIRFVIPYAPGGNTDMIGRVLGAKLTESMGQTVVVENRGGAVTLIGAENVAKAPPDGYSMLLATSTTLAKCMPIQPEVPTVVEMGLPNCVFYPWQGVVVPAKTPPEIVTRLQAELKKALQSPDVRERTARV